MLGRHKDDANFFSMNLSMCALLITQPVPRNKHDSMPVRHDFTIRMLQAALSLREFIFRRGRHRAGRHRKLLHISNLP
jgi:hypothetical protein